MRKFRLRYFFSNPQTVDFQSDAQGSSNKFLDPQELYTNAQYYKFGLQYMNQGKYRLGIEFFKKVTDFLEANSLEKSQYWSIIKNKVAYSLNQMRCYGDCTQVLESVIRNHRQFDANEVNLYTAYNNLFIHYLNTDLSKAILLGKALLSEKEQENVPLSFQKQFTFNLGTAYLLNENFVDSKLRLRECLVSDPNSLLKGYALNNLAIASWFHKSPNPNSILKEEFKEEEYSYSDIDKDYSNVPHLLKRSIRNLEDNENMSYLDWLLDEQNFIPSNAQDEVPVQLRNKQCGIPLLNLTEFYQNRDKLQFWLRTTSEFYESVDPSNNQRIMILLAQVCRSQNQQERAETIFKNTLKLLEKSDSYNKVLCMQLYGSLLKSVKGKEQQVEIFYNLKELINKAYEEAEQLPYWSNKRVHILLPELEV